MRVLITGTSGHIGDAVARRLQAEAAVVGLDLDPGPCTEQVGDICDRNLVQSLMDDVDAVVHLAGLHAPHVGKRSEEEFRHINVEGTQTLLECALQAGVDHFIYTSTTSVYGCTGRARGRAIWVTETVEPSPQDIYDTTKLEAEALCRAAATKGMRVTILRMSRCFPEPPHLITFYRLYRGVDKRDVAECHALALKTHTAGLDVFNVSGPTPFLPEDCHLLWHDPWKVIDRHYPDAKADFMRRGWDIPECIDRVYVIEKAKRLLGYQPKYDFRAALTGDP